MHVKSTKTLQFNVLDIPIHVIPDEAFYVVTMIKDHFELFPAGADSPLFLTWSARGLTPVL